jgi:hypothetical protein
VKKSLIKEFTPVDDPAQAARYGLTGAFCTANFDIVLQPTAVNCPSSPLAVLSAEGTRALASLPETALPARFSA